MGETKYVVGGGCGGAPIPKNWRRRRKQIIGSGAARRDRRWTLPFSVAEMNDSRSAVWLNLSVVQMVLVL